MDVPLDGNNCCDVRQEWTTEASQSVPVTRDLKNTISAAQTRCEARLLCWSLQSDTASTVETDNLFFKTSSSVQCSTSLIVCDQREGMLACVCECVSEDELV